MTRAITVGAGTRSIVPGIKLRLFDVMVTSRLSNGRSHKNNIKNLHESTLGKPANGAINASGSKKTSSTYC